MQFAADHAEDGRCKTCSEQLLWATLKPSEGLWGGWKSFSHDQDPFQTLLQPISTAGSGHSTEWVILTLLSNKRNSDRPDKNDLGGALRRIERQFRAYPR